VLCLVDGGILTPIYEYCCGNQHLFERYLSFQDYSLPQVCECGRLGERIISAPILVVAQPNVCYDSPIDGTPITSMAQRRQDMDKHNCQDYDPMMKQDYMARIADSEKALEKQVDEHVDKIWEKLPTAVKGKMASEVVDQGMTPTIERGTK